MTKFGLIGPLVAVEIAWGFSAVMAAGCEDQLGYNFVDKVGIENASFDFRGSAQPTATLSHVLWEGKPMDAPLHEQINQLGGS